MALDIAIIINHINLIPYIKNTCFFANSKNLNKKILNRNFGLKPVNFDLTMIIDKNDINLDFRQNTIQIPHFYYYVYFYIFGYPASGVLRILK